MLIYYYGVNKTNVEDWHGPYLTWDEADFENHERANPDQYSIVSKIIEE